MASYVFLGSNISDQVVVLLSKQIKEYQMIKPLETHDGLDPNILVIIKDSKKEQAEIAFKKIFGLNWKERLVN